MNENLSAWMDGELESDQGRLLALRLKRDPGLRGDWDCYHLIGDALRGVHGAELGASIRVRLEDEPTVLAPRRRARAERLRWFALSAAASVAAVIFVGWMALSGVQQDTLQIAATADVKPVAAPAGEGAKDYLLAHQRYSPSNAMQGVAPYVRTVAEERGGARR